MVFVDFVEIVARSGKGGDGCVNFRREKFEPRGGPDGGDGGGGGDVVAQVDSQLNTLLDFRYRHTIEAGPGARGGKNNRTGHRGEDAEIRVPPGTVIRDAQSKQVLADLTDTEERVVLVGGGRGGRGNTHFKTPTRQAPDHAQPGREGTELELELELKLIADVGFVGLPNAGKSTLLSRISAARPKIADYPFTTLQPNLGIVRVGDYDSLVVADIPGLIEGAHEGKGLGIQFLRHIERTRALCYLVDASSTDPAGDLEVLRNELIHFSPAIVRKPSLLALSKIDLVPAEDRPDAIGPRRIDHQISSITGAGIDNFIRALGICVADLRNAEEVETEEMKPYRP